MAPRLRSADRDECAASGYTPLDALVEGFETSTYSYTLEDDQGEPFAIFGVGPIPGRPGWGAPWMLGTDGIKDNWLWFSRNSAEVIRRCHEGYANLYNFVDVRNTVHVRWLKWVGFTFGAVTALGPHGLPFNEFYRTT